MKAAIYEAFAQPLTIQNVPDPSPPADGVVIKVLATGLCRSDWHGWMGHDPDIQNLPHVPGHEMAGIIAETGPEVQGWQPGDRVTLPFALGCGRCPQCMVGNQHICNHYFQPGFTGWGSFAQYVAVPYANTNLVRLPEEIDFMAAASLGCRFITSFRAVVAQGQVSAGEWVVIHGCGGVGLAAIMIARASGANVIGVDIKNEALAMAQALGASHTLNARQETNLIETIHDLTGGGAHLSLDALGSAVTCRNSILSLRKQGRHVQVGLMTADDKNAPLPIDQVIGKELEILGSHGMQAHAYGPMLAMIKAGILTPQKLVSKTITLAEAPAALAAMGEFNTLGVVVIDQF
ncbi:MAG: zinc-dependent alcohol dehydrogenase family protein [Anaerolineae bacterium]|nr:zinc-dependent alcohol dehydrogenase family protein [Anaerolineae bacterium]